VVEIYYDSDKKVQGDEEIQGFVKDCHAGMKKSHSENRFNFSKAMFTQEDEDKHRCKWGLNVLSLPPFDHFCRKSI